MKVNNIKVNKILDSRGEWTIEVEIEGEGIKEKASIPLGKSKGAYEAISLSYEEIQKKLDEFLKDIKNKDFQNLKELDYFLIEEAGKNKERLGGNFTLGISIAFGRILAKVNNQEFYEYLKYEYPQNEDEHIPIPQLVLNIIGGGVHSFNNLDFQEYWLVTRTDANLTQTNANKYEFFTSLIGNIISVINKLEKKLPKPLGRNDEGAFCTNFSDNYEPFLYLKEFINNYTDEKQIIYGLETDLSANHPGNIPVNNPVEFYFEIGADIAANQITKLVNWKNIYKKLKLLDVKYLEDPFKEDEFEKFAELRKDGFKVIGDDLTTTNIERLKIALEKNSVDGVIVKPNQIGTITETFEFAKLARENNLFTIFSHRSGETNDYWIIDLGIAFETDYFKIGVPLQGERVAKYNRLLEIYGKINSNYEISRN